MVQIREKTSSPFLQTCPHYPKNVDLKDSAEDEKCERSKAIRQKLNRCGKEPGKTSNKLSVGALLIGKAIYF